MVPPELRNHSSRKNCRSSSNPGTRTPLRAFPAHTRDDLPPPYPRLTPYSPSRHRSLSPTGPRLISEGSHAAVSPDGRNRKLRLFYGAEPGDKNDYLREASRTNSRYTAQHFFR